jgi:hypothetical protein
MPIDPFCDDDRVEVLLTFLCKSACDEEPGRILNVLVVWAAGASERKVPASP